ncbi:DUF5381 family protein [Metabacillus idriensis]|uniref:DUF5381 family protein n=1 Tax=Metabacillus idriensis TaxID=324768 RepID=UPI001CD526E7|nr:DUF5381 family protein [Metabacillus idriensis]
MLNLISSGSNLQVKGSKFYYGILAAFILGGLLGTSYLIFDGLKFSSAFSFLWIVGGFIFFPIYLYLFIWFLPGLIPGKVLISLFQGNDGYLVTKKGNISFKQIRNIDLVRNPLNLVNNMVIETFDGRVIKIPTYDLIDDTDFAVIVDKYIFLHLTPEAKQVWDCKVNLDKLYENVKYERETGIKG